MKNIVEINGKKYELIRNDGDCFTVDTVVDKITEYFENFDYIFGDFAYEKVRLKGYYDSNNTKASKINDIQYIDDYIRNYCCFGAKVFLLKKMK